MNVYRKIKMYKSNEKSFTYKRENGPYNVASLYRYRTRPKDHPF